MTQIVGYRALMFCADFADLRVNKACKTLCILFEWMVHDYSNCNYHA